MWLLGQGRACPLHKRENSSIGPLVFCRQVDGVRIPPPQPAKSLESYLYGVISPRSMDGLPLDAPAKPATRLRFADVEVSPAALPATLMLMA